MRYNECGDVMKTIAGNVIVYGILGFLLERMLNVFFLGYWHDNSLLYGPYQLMYGMAVAFTIVFYAWVKQFALPRVIKIISLIIVAIFLTGMVEHSVGTLHHSLYSIILWDYRMTFTVCAYPFTCVIPTTLFGLLSAFAVLYVHPTLTRFIDRIPGYVKGVIFMIVAIDIVLTYAGGITL